MYNKEAVKKYQEKNKDKLKKKHCEYVKTYYEKNKDKIEEWKKGYYIKKKYGITIDERNTMYEEQNGKCAICGKHYDVLCVDHDHTTNKVRSLLCRRCNRELGVVERDVSNIYKMIQYLNKYK